MKAEQVAALAVDAFRKELTRAGVRLIEDGGVRPDVASDVTVSMAAEAAVEAASALSKASAALEPSPVELDFSTMASLLSSELDTLDEQLANEDWRNDRHAELLQVRATMLGALATEHVAERLDRLIDLLFDEGRAVTVSSVPHGSA